IEILNQLVFWNAHKESVTDVAFLAVILVALILQRSKTSRAMEVGSTWSMAAVLRPMPSELKKLPEVKYTRLGGILLMLFLAIYVPLHVPASTVSLMATAMVWGIVAVSLVELTGWGGHI